MKPPFLDKSFWSDRRVFVTGHTGFKGSWLTLWLDLLGAKVKGYSLEPDTSPNLFDSLNLKERCEHVIGDISDFGNLQRELADFRPETVFHLAAQPLVRRSYDAPLLTFQSNVMGTANLLEACRAVPSLDSIVIVTTDKCYENKSDGQPFVETDRLGGFDPYSASKACAELTVGSFRDSFFNVSNYANHGVSLATARAGNVIGGGDWSPTRLVPDAMRAFSSGGTLQIRMAHAVRPWQHVIEPLLGYLLLAQKCALDGAHFSQAWNFGPRQEQVLSVGELIELAADKWPQAAHWENYSEENAKKESDILLLDSHKAEAHLGWQSTLDIDATLSLTIDWYDAFYRQAQSNQLAEITESQITRYMSITT